MRNVIKRDGEREKIAREKIFDSLCEANEHAYQIKKCQSANKSTLIDISMRVTQRCRKRREDIEIFELQDMIETELMKAGAFETAKQFMRLHYKNEVKINE